MKKILIPVDFSGNTEIACSYALEIADQEGAVVRLFHTYSDQFIIADSSFPDTIDMSTMYNEELLKEIMHQSEKKMEQLHVHLEETAKKRHKKNIEFQISLVGGEIEGELREQAKEFLPDIIVMGTSGMGRTSNRWGRVSTHIINNSKVPVLTVPEIKKFMGFNKIMLAADLSGNIDELINKLFLIFREFPIKIYCVHFLIKESESEENIKMEKLRKSFVKEEKARKIFFKIVEVKEDKQIIINREIETQSIDVIAFQPHKHNIFYNLFTSRITKKNLQATNVPLLSLPLC